jgi:ornithine cyclodeaminase/alanine dehydrogenase-like protein (mu-crystallin family)
VLLPPLRYLSADDVRAAMPPVLRRIELARKTMVALVEDAEVPPKFGVHPRPEASHTAAMPALLRGPRTDAAADLLGMKWVTAFPANRDLGLDAIHATIVLNDASNGMPLAILDGAPITAERTAAVSGVALQEWWPKQVRRGGGGGSSSGDDGGVKVALIGAGVQGVSHVAVLAAVTEGASLTICARHRERADDLAAQARATGRFAAVDTTLDPVAAATGADVVLTMVSFGAQRQLLPAVALSDATLIIAVDYDMCIPAETARSSSLFVTDDVAQLLATRVGDTFAGYPEPDASIGQALLGRGPSRRASGPIFVDHLGVGLADVVFADEIVRTAAERGIGTELTR